MIYHDYDLDSIEIRCGLETFLEMVIVSYLTLIMIEKSRNLNKYVAIKCVPEQKSSIRIAEKYGFQDCDFLE